MPAVNHPKQRSWRGSECQRRIGWDDPLWSPRKGTAERKRLENCVWRLNRFIIKTRHSFHCLDFMQNNLWKQDSLWSSEWFLKWKVVILKENCPQIKNFKVKYYKTVHTVLLCYLYYTEKMLRIMHELCYWLNLCLSLHGVPFWKVVKTMKTNFL